MRFQGRIVDWHDEKGFGFVSPTGREERAFLHIKAFSRRGRRPAGNELVSFTMATDAKGRLRAERVAFVVLGAKPAPVRGSTRWRGVIAAIFLTAVACLCAFGTLPAEVVGVYLVASAITFVLYAFDKAAARRGDQRTPESWLQLMSLLGGWPGALVGQHVMQHKTRKASFQLTFWFTVAANIVAIVYLLSAPGSRFLADLLAR